MYSITKDAWFYSLFTLYFFLMLINIISFLNPSNIIVGLIALSFCMLGWLICVIMSVYTIYRIFR